MNLLQVVRQSADLSPNKVFLVQERRKRTFKQFYERVQSAGSGFSSLGLKQGDKAAILLNNSIEFMEAYFAVISIGAVIVPLNTFLKAEEVAYILNDCRVKVLITSSEFKSVVDGLKPGQVPALDIIVSVDEIPGKTTVQFSTLFLNGEAQDIRMSQDDIAVIIYTSGTTGHPKGAMLSHKNIVSDVENSIHIIGMSEKDILMAFLPMFHSYSFTANCMISLYCRCKLVVIPSIQPFTRVVKNLILHRVSVFIAIPQIYSILATKKMPFWFHLLNPMRLCISGGASLPVDSFHKFEKSFNKPLVEGYGLSEASPICALNPLYSKRKAASIGPSINNVEIKIVDDNGKEVAMGESGEMIVKGDNVMKGYYNNPEATSQAIKDGWLYTGDIGKKDEEGYIFILDRKKDLIIVNGMNVYPREVEEILYAHPAIADAAVVGQKEAMHGEIPVAVVVLKEGATVDEKELRKYCRLHIANFKVPHRVEFWKELPRNSTGKVVKREIKKMVDQEQKFNK